MSAKCQNRKSPAIFKSAGLRPRRASGHPQIGWPQSRRDQSTDKCGPPLGFDLNRSPWLRWQLENRGLLILIQECQEHDPAVRKFQRIVMAATLSLLICRKIAVLCSITLSLRAIKPVGKHLTSSAKDSSVPGRTQTAMFMSSDAANPTVPVPKLCVVSLSPTFAGRDLTLWRL